MLVTTMAALVWKAVGFLFPPAGESVNLTLGVACVVLLMLGGLVAAEAPRCVGAARARESNRGQTDPGNIVLRKFR